MAMCVPVPASRMIFSSSIGRFMPERRLKASFLMPPRRVVCDSAMLENSSLVVYFRPLRALSLASIS